MPFCDKTSDKTVKDSLCGRRARKWGKKDVNLGNPHCAFYIKFWTVNAVNRHLRNNLRSLRNSKKKDYSESKIV